MVSAIQKIKDAGKDMAAAGGAAAGGTAMSAAAVGTMALQDGATLINGLVTANGIVNGSLNALIAAASEVTNGGFEGIKKSAKNSGKAIAVTAGDVPQA